MNDTALHPDDFADEFESALAALQARIEPACAERGDWAAQVAAAIRTAFAFAAADPAAAQVLTIRALAAAGPAMRATPACLPTSTRACSPAGPSAPRRRGASPPSPPPEPRVSGKGANPLPSPSHLHVDEPRCGSRHPDVRTLRVRLGSTGSALGGPTD